MKILFTSLILFLPLFMLNSWGAENTVGTYRTPEQKSGEYQRPLTEQEQIKAMDFQHTGLIQRTREAECAKSKKRQSACLGEQAKVFRGYSDAIIEKVGQSFSLFAGQLGNENTKGKTDYCSYIAQLTTIISQGLQFRGQEAIGSRLGPKSAQKESLYKQARAHRTRARTAQVERLGWGATTGCYATMAFRPGVQSNKKTYLKMGASAFLTYFYNRQRNQHHQYANIVNNIANALPGPGDCNPITEQNCYCAQEETAQDPQYCLPFHGKKKGLPQGTVAVTCVNAQFEFDPHCNCASNGTCADQAFRPLFQFPEFSSNTVAGKSLHHVKELANGRFNKAALAHSAFGQGAFKKALSAIDKNIAVENKPLTESQKKTARLLTQSGLPKRMAAELSRTALPQGHSPTANKQAKLHRKTTHRYRRVPTLSMKDPFRKKSRRKSKQNIPFPTFKKKGRPKYKDEVIQFASEAEKKASVSKDRSKSIFETISYRYQNTGLEKLEFKTP